MVPESTRVDSPPEEEAASDGQRTSAQTGESCKGMLDRQTDTHDLHGDTRSRTSCDTESRSLAEIVSFAVSENESTSNRNPPYETYYTPLWAFTRVIRSYYPSLPPGIRACTSFSTSTPPLRHNQIDHSGHLLETSQKKTHRTPLTVFHACNPRTRSSINVPMSLAVSSSSCKKRDRSSKPNIPTRTARAVPAAQKPKVVIQASGVGYYGFRGGTKLDEEQAPGDDFLARVGIQWEASTARVEDMGVRRVVIRTGVVLSPSGGTLSRMLTPFRLFVGGPLGTGRQWFSWIHIEDEVAAIRFLLENETASGAFNLVAPIAVNNMQFSRTLGRVLKRPSLVRTPALPLRLLFGEMAALLLEGQRAVPLHLGQLGFKFRFPEVEAALRDLLG